MSRLHAEAEPEAEAAEPWSGLATWDAVKRCSRPTTPRATSACTFRIIELTPSVNHGDGIYAKKYVSGQNQMYRVHTL